MIETDQLKQISVSFSFQFSMFNLLDFTELSILNKAIKSI
jgi:hypothetical protein